MHTNFSQWLITSVFITEHLITSLRCVLAESSASLRSAWLHLGSMQIQDANWCKFYSTCFRQSKQHKHMELMAFGCLYYFTMFSFSRKTNHETHAYCEALNWVMWRDRDAAYCQTAELWLLDLLEQGWAITFLGGPNDKPRLLLGAKKFSSCCNL